MITTVILVKWQKGQRNVITVTVWSIYLSARCPLPRDRKKVNDNRQRDMASYAKIQEVSAGKESDKDKPKVKEDELYDNRVNTIQDKKVGALLDTGAEVIVQED